MDSSNHPHSCSCHRIHHLDIQKKSCCSYCSSKVNISDDSEEITRYLNRSKLAEEFEVEERSPLKEVIRGLVDVSKLKILVGFLQVFSQLNSTYDIPWPSMDI